MGLFELVLVALAGIAGGMVNALAGGGTLITFPLLTAVGIPAIAANVTNTVALSPGYLGATFAQSKDLQGQKRRLWLTLPAGVIGGIIGGILLLNTGERLFRSIVPFLILLASALLAVADPLRAWLLKRSGEKNLSANLEKWAVIPVLAAAIYGGYFGAGLSVIVLAVLGLIMDDTLTRLNAMKQFIAFSVNIAAAIFFLFSGQVVWLAAIVMAVGALLGGSLGGRLASRVKPAVLRRLVVIIGVVVAVIYLVRS
ncbi:MAG: sulfite exporter TauE/SafE family protein [Chloroflexota bacterium]|nr:MAG: sulfite exporter TauE/SafE family protein [Chloroflexota bacterium]